jgi:hypothetical protein
MVEKRPEMARDRQSEARSSMDLPAKRRRGW